MTAPQQQLDTTTVEASVECTWASALPALAEYVRIPAISRAFDADWEVSGHIQRGVDHIEQWIRAHLPDEARVWQQQIDGRTPVLFAEIPARGELPHTAETVLLYGHLDKQPAGTGWGARDPWEPIEAGDFLYGRGVADDGFAPFAMVAAVRALRDTDSAHGRILMLLEASEESHSMDLPAHLDLIGDGLGTVGLVVVLDAGAWDYEHLSVVTSLRGMLSADVRVHVAEEGLHSGLASGAVPSSFRVMRVLLDRIEDSDSGEILIEALRVVTPEGRRKEISIAAGLGLDLAATLPLAGSTQPMNADPAGLLHATLWEPTLSYIAADGIPPLISGGNVLRPYTTLRLSFRTPPHADLKRAGLELTRRLTENVPYNATVDVDITVSSDGWEAPEAPPWLTDSIRFASNATFGNDPHVLGVGGSIPIAALLADQFPAAQFLVTGVLGPGSNAHAPNERLHVPTAKKVSAATAHIVAAHAQRP